MHNTAVEATYGKPWPEPGQDAATEVDEAKSQRSSYENDFMAKEAGLNEHVRFLEASLHLSHIHHRPSGLLEASPGVTPLIAAPDDVWLSHRIAVAYRLAAATALGSPDSFWLTDIAKIRRPEHETLATGQLTDVQAMLRDPGSNNLFYGFDILARGHMQAGRPFHEMQAALCYDALLRMAEALGAVCLFYPETDLRHRTVSTDEAIELIEDVIGSRIDFPNPYPGEVGLQTGRGVASYRAIQALFQGYLISRLARGGRVVEIGGGLGRTAYYARRLGVASYTIVDLPLGGAAQAYFLGRAGMGVRLHAERRGGPIELIPPEEFAAGAGRYDLCVNVDSFTEMAAETVIDYIDHAARRTNALLSINHEFNKHRVFDILREHPTVASCTRELYWLRRGYVQEFVTFHRSH